MQRISIIRVNKNVNTQISSDIINSLNVTNIDFAKGLS